MKFFLKLFLKFFFEIFRKFFEFLKFFFGPFEREKEVLHYEAMQDLNYPRDMPFDGNVSNDEWYYNRIGFKYRGNSAIRQI